MTIIRTDHLGEFLDEQFDVFELEHSGDHLCIAIERELKCTGVAFQHVASKWLWKRVGQPRAELSQPLQGRRLSAFEHLKAAMDSSLMANGIVLADDVIDGECYFVQQRSNDSLIRLVLSNPRLIGNADIDRFVNTLDALLRV